MDTVAQEYNMKAVEPRSLFSDKIKKISFDGEMVDLFNQWVKLMNENNQELSSFNCFIAGWILSNPSVHQKFKDYREKEIRYDERIQNL